MINIGINGFGRIGRLASRIIMNSSQFNLVSINHPTIDKKNLDKLITYDSVHGYHDFGEKTNITIHNQKDPNKIIWEDNLDIILETTGQFKELDDLQHYNKNINTKIIVSAPSKTLPMFIYGVNHETYKNENIISGASCTTTCLAPLVDILHKHYYIKSGLATTIHSVTASQQAVDKLNPNSRTGRTLLNNIIPSTTGAAKSIGKIIPELDGVLNAIGVRVPVQNVSLLDLTLELEQFPEIKDIIDEITNESKHNYKDIVYVDNNELVSSDFIGSPYACIVDSKTIMKQGDLYKIMAWYDNEYGYAYNLVRLAAWVS
jgi:glyceraldehyde 3-phosphate dehydrogenase